MSEGTETSTEPSSPQSDMAQSVDKGIHNYPAFNNSAGVGGARNAAIQYVDSSAKHEREESYRVDRRKDLEKIIEAKREEKAAQAEAKEVLTKKTPEAEIERLSTLARDDPQALAREVGEKIGVPLDRFPPEWGTGEVLERNVTAMLLEHQQAQLHAHGQREYQKFLRENGIDPAYVTQDMGRRFTEKVQEIRAENPRMPERAILREALMSLPEGRKHLMERGKDRYSVVRDVVKSKVREQRAERGIPGDTMTKLTQAFAEEGGVDFKALSAEKYQQLEAEVIALRAIHPKATHGEILEAAATRLKIPMNPTRKWGLWKHVR